MLGAAEVTALEISLLPAKKPCSILELFSSTVEVTGNILSLNLTSLSFTAVSILCKGVLFFSDSC